ncbi:allantoate deiminase [Halobacillus salinarum]|uniref:Allantoate deiminase n=1 Tax=Halobacillus salinarum TaxID=2932257 RepID=A0ABY4EJK2_9BACI|nr:allantoate deiminase [Halobacillus salinarum]UOQ43697.1 allantoate deiminase [Halobacillus salinarum]
MASKRETSTAVTDTAEDLVKWLGSFGQSKSGGVTRPLYSEPWMEAQHALQKKMELSGLETYYDSVGNLFGRLEGTNPDSNCILTGSHIDTVVNGGIYDGVYGIVASYSAVQKLRKQFGHPRKTIEIVSLCEEEGSRFPITFWGSGNITGNYSLQDAVGKNDHNGVSLLEAMKAAGFDPETYQNPKREDIECFLECHIEQGIVLEKTATSIGVVSHIAGQRRYTIKLSGESNHAGTTPMHFRKDAMVLAAQFITYLTDKAEQADSDLVATTGKLTASPNVSNVIAGEVTFTLDVRHYKKRMLDQFCREVLDHFHQKADHFGFALSYHTWLEADPVQMDQDLQAQMAAAVREENLSYQSMFSGAGHDAQMFGSFCPSSLLFVPSKNGISHSPKEFTSSQFLEQGIQVLTRMLYQLAY